MEPDPDDSSAAVDPAATDPDVGDPAGTELDGTGPGPNGDAAGLDDVVDGELATTWLHALGIGRSSVDGPRPLLVQLGVASWSAIGIVAVAALVVVGLATVSSVVLPLLFAAVLAVIFRPVAVWLQDRGVPAGLAAALVVLGLVLTAFGIVAVTIRGVVTQSDEIVVQIEQSLAELEVGEDLIAEIRAGLEDANPGVSSGIVQAVVTGVSTVAAVAIGSVLAVLIMYYLVKDGDRLRRQIVGRAPSAHAAELDGFITDSVAVLRRYWLGRSIVSAIVAVFVALAALALGLPLVLTIGVVTFVGGFIPYFGAAIGGLLAIAVALGSEGLVAAAIMLAVVLAGNLLVENLVEPAVTGRTLQVHPLTVLLVTTAGGVIGGLVGLVMAVPITVLTVRGLPRLRRILAD